MFRFFHMLKGMLLRSPWSNRAEIRNHPLQAFMTVLLTCKNYEDTIKKEGDRCANTTFLPLLVYRNFFNAQGQLTPQSLVESGHNSN